MSQVTKCVLLSMYVSLVTEHLPKKGKVLGLILNNTPSNSIKNHMTLYND